MSWLISILSAENREVAVEACYFVARELKQLTVPADLRKDPLADAEASLPTQEARAVGQRIVDEIKSREGKQVLDLSRERALHYLDLVVDAGRQIARSGTHVPTEGRRLLAGLRAAAGEFRPSE